MIRLSDYLVHRIAELSVKHVFMVSGGGAMHLVDSLGRSTEIEYFCNHHEQASAMAAEGYARVRGGLGVVLVTSGPGATNAVTGVLGQWQDSIPALYISGQVRRSLTVSSTGLPLRQLGDQEADIVSIVRPITKYAAMVRNPERIRYHLEKAVHLATSGRPGPVWLDIPLDIQAAMVDERRLVGYEAPEDGTSFDVATVQHQVALLCERLQRSERPILLAGSGIRHAAALDLFERVVSKLGIPVQVAWNAIDLVPNEHPLFAGRPGTLGQRGANLAFQNADLLLSVGCRLNPRQIGYNYESVAREAYKVAVDIDAAELEKPTVRLDMGIHSDVAAFLRILEARLSTGGVGRWSDWLAWCRERLRSYPSVQPGSYDDAGGVNPYAFSETLSECLDHDAVIVSANGVARFAPIQTLTIKRGQRHIINSGAAAMGHALPASIGASLARGKGPVVCLDGDGSLQMNLQEFQTIVHHNLPIKIFVFNNGGYQTIRSTQKGMFDGYFVGESASTGVSFPDMERIAHAYGIRSLSIVSHSNMRECVAMALDAPGPVLCDVHISPDVPILPRVASVRLADGEMVSSPLEDMYPYLDREELRRNMIVPLWEGPSPGGRVQPQAPGTRSQDPTPAVPTERKSVNGSTKSLQSIR